MADGGTPGDSKAMSAQKAAPQAATASQAMAALRRQYGSGPAKLTGTAHALYERHLLFDNVTDPTTAGLRQRYEALARSLRDILSQRWVRTEQTYERVNPKRVYYLSMEFLIGRSLTNNITNLLLSPLVSDAVEQKSLDWLGLLEEEPDAGLGNGGLAAPFTVNTMPEGTLKALADHGALGGSLPADGGDCEEVPARFAGAGIDVDLLAGQLQDEGAKSFVDSWHELMEVIASKSAALAEAS
jgi:hypothetical protein